MPWGSCPQPACAGKDPEFYGKRAYPMSRSSFQVVFRKWGVGHVKFLFDSRHFCLVLLRIPPVALLRLSLAQELVRYMDQAQSPWQCFQKRLLKLLLIQSLGLDKLYREQVPIGRLQPDLQ